MAASWQPLVFPAFDVLEADMSASYLFTQQLADNPPLLLGVRAGSYETGFKVFRHRNPPRSRCKGFHALRKISITF